MILESITANYGTNNYNIIIIIKTLLCHKDMIGYCAVEVFFKGKDNIYSAAV